MSDHPTIAPPTGGNAVDAAGDGGVVHRLEALEARQRKVELTLGELVRVVVQIAESATALQAEVEQVAALVAQVRDGGLTSIIRGRKRGND